MSLTATVPSSMDVLSPRRPRASAPSPEPAAAAEPEPEPAAELQPAPYRAPDPGAPMPPEVEGEALTLLARARGRASVDELAGAIRILDGEATAATKSLSNPASVRPALTLVLDRSTRAAAYRRRLTALAAILGVPVPPLSNPPALPELVAVLARDGQPTELARSLRAAATQARSEAEGLGRQVDGLTGICADDRHYAAIRPDRQTSADRARELAELEARQQASLRAPVAWVQDVRLAQLESLLRRRRAAVGRVAALEGDSDRLVELVKAKVTGAIEAAGGNEAVTTAIVAALALTEPSPSPSTELAQVDADLGRLAAAGVTQGPAYEGLAARQAILRGQHEADQAARIERRKDRAEAMLAGASAGDESSRAALESVAVSQPSAFPVGFAGQIAGARADRAAFAELAAGLN